MTPIATEPDAVRIASLHDALAANDPEPAIEQAFLRMRGAGDLSLLMAVVKALVRVGIPGLAVRFLQAVAGLNTNPQLTALAEMIAKLPSGEVARETLQARLLARRDALVQVNAHVGAIPADVPTTLHAFRTVKGNVHVVRDQPTREIDVVFPLADHAARAAALEVPQSNSFCLLGVPTPQLFRRLLAQRASDGYTPPIDIIEPDAGIFALWLALLDDAEPLFTERVTCFVGNGATQRYREYLLQHPWREPAMHTLTNRRPGFVAPPINREFDTEVQGVIDARKQNETARGVRRYAGKTRDHWRDRFATAGRTAPPLRIVGFTTRYSTVMQHAISDLASAFKRRSCEFELVKEPSNCSRAVDIRKTLADRDFDAVVIINHLRFEYRDGIPDNVPFVCWIQDHMDQLCTPRAGSSIGALDLVISHSPHVLAALYGYPLERSIGTSNLTDAATYCNEPLPESELMPHRCDVSFASHGSEPPEFVIDQMCNGAPDTFRTMALRFFQLMRARLARDGWINGHDLAQLMLDAESDTKHPPLPSNVRRTVVYPQFARLYDRVFRHQAIEWTARWAKSRGRRFRLYGRGWNEHPTFAPFAAGIAANGRELRAVYQASSISLQVNGYSSLHQRLLDGIASGGFMLCRWNAADFIRASFLRIQHAIRSNGFTTAEQVVRLRERDESFNATCDEAERLSSACIRLVGDARRDAHIRSLRAGNHIPDLTTDAGLFDVLNEMRLIPERVAADLPDFEQTTFRDEVELHAQLDRFVDDRTAREAIARPMRASVVKHDTYDGLVERIIAAFGTNT